MSALIMILMTMIVGLSAAGVWWWAAKVRVYSGLSYGRGPGLDHIAMTLDTQLTADKAAQLNSIAARLTALAVVLGAVTEIMSIIPTLPH